MKHEKKWPPCFNQWKIAMNHINSDRSELQWWAALSWAIQYAKGGCELRRPPPVASSSTQQCRCAISSFSSFQYKRWSRNWTSEVQPAARTHLEVASLYYWRWTDFENRQLLRLILTKGAMAIWASHGCFSFSSLFLFSLKLKRLKIYRQFFNQSKTAMNHINSNWSVLQWRGRCHG